MAKTKGKHWGVRMRTPPECPRGGAPAERTKYSFGGGSYKPVWVWSAGRWQSGSVRNIVDNSVSVQVIKGGMLLFGL